MFLAFGLWNPTLRFSAPLRFASADRNPVGVDGFSNAFTQGSSFLATLGLVTESLWDSMFDVRCFTIRTVGADVRRLNLRRRIIGPPDVGSYNTSCPSSSSFSLFPFIGCSEFDVGEEGGWQNIFALSRAELDWLGLYENIRLLCLQIVPARSGVDRSLKRLLALAELPPAPPRKSSLHRLLATRREHQPVEAGRERQHRHEGRGDDGWLEASGQECAYPRRRMLRAWRSRGSAMSRSLAKRT